MFWYFSKERRQKRNERFYKMGRIKAALKSGLIFAIGFIVLDNLVDYFILDKSILFDNSFIKNNLIHFIINLLLWSFIGYHLNWSMVEEKYLDYKNKQNEEKQH